MVPVTPMEPQRVLLESAGWWSLDTLAFPYSPGHGYVCTHSHRKSHPSWGFM